MKFNYLLKEAIFLQRKCDNIIEADSNGERLVIYCPNSNKLNNCAILGSRIWYSPAEFMPIYKPATWQLAEIDYGKLVLVNNNICSDLFLESYNNGLITISDLKAKNSKITVDPKLSNNHYFDFAIENNKNKQETYIKLASSTLCNDIINNTDNHKFDTFGYFPEANFIDNESTRDELYDLITAKMMGHRAILCCFILTEDCNELYLTDKYNSKYAKVLKTALELGVEFIAYNIVISANKLTIGNKVKVIADGLGVHITSS